MNQCLAILIFMADTRLLKRGHFPHNPADCINHIHRNGSAGASAQLHSEIDDRFKAHTGKGRLLDNLHRPVLMGQIYARKKMSILFFFISAPLFHILGGRKPSLNGSLSQRFDY
jgi:hypothetical protein